MGSGLHTLRISKIKLKLHWVHNVETDPGKIGCTFHGKAKKLGQKGQLAKVSFGFLRKKSKRRKIRIWQEDNCRRLEAIIGCRWFCLGMSTPGAQMIYI